MMNIDGIGEETAATLYALGLVKNIGDLYALQAHQLRVIEGMGDKSAQRIIDGIEASKAVPFERVVFALSIPFVGETTARKIAANCHDIDTLMQMTHEQLCGIPDVGPRIADSIIEYFAQPINRQNIEALRAAGVQMQADTSADDDLRTDKLGGKAFVISGVFAKHSRDEYKHLIELNGGRNVGSISKKTDYVLAGENMGPAKLEKARNLGIPIIDEDQFLAMIE